MKGSRIARVRASAAGEARSWKGKHDALLDVLAAILYAQGAGADHRIAVATVYYQGRVRRPIVVDAAGDRFIVRFESPDIVQRIGDPPLDMIEPPPPELSRWQRILSTVRRVIRGRNA